MQPPPTLTELLADSATRGDPVAALPRLVSRTTGVIRSLEPVTKDPSEPFLPLILRAEVANHRFLADETAGERTASGKGMTLSAARASAVGEAVERYSAECFDERRIRYAAWNELDAPALDPRELVLFAPDQYPELPYAPYDPDTEFGWVPARSLVSDRAVLVPAMAVYMGYEPAPKEWIFATTSNGLAAGAMLAGAVLSALLEVVERDAYLSAWLHRLPCERIEPWNHPDADLVALREAYRRRGVEIHLFRLPADHPASVHLALGTEADGGDGPAAVVGLGADPDPARSARAAVLEVGQGRPSLRRHLRLAATQERIEELVDDPSRVARLEDHDLLYADRRSLGAFDFLLRRPAVPGEWKRQLGDAADELRRLVEHFRASGDEVLYCDLTPPDMRALGLYTARVIVPGFQPIHFGRRERRLGGTRLFELPVRLGLANGTAAPGELNPDPHPLA